jgi:outer membrane immunogenic protein
MKKILLASVATSLLMAGAASAADLPRRSAPVAPLAPIAAVPLFTWTGFYVGVNAGYGFSDSNDDAVFVPQGTFLGALAGSSGVVSNGGNENDGFVGGAQVGYNLQFGAFVVGVEADIQYADLGGDNNRTAVYTPQTGLNPVAFGFRPGSAVSGIEYFGTVRARAGVAFDRVLVYATGGFAFGGFDGGNGGFVDDGDDIQGGYAVGGGIEYAFTNNITAKIEGLYVNLDRGNGRTFVGTDAAGNAVLVGGRNGDVDFGVVRAGINFKFNTF